MEEDFDLITLLQTFWARLWLMGLTRAQWVLPDSEKWGNTVSSSAQSDSYLAKSHFWVSFPTNV